MRPYCGLGDPVATHGRVRPYCGLGDPVVRPYCGLGDPVVRPYCGLGDPVATHGRVSCWSLRYTWCWSGYSSMMDGGSLAESTDTHKRPMGLDTLLENQLGHWPKLQKLHIHPLSTPWGRGRGGWCLNWAYFHSMGNGFGDKGWFSKLPYLGMKRGHWPKF